MVPARWHLRVPKAHVREQVHQKEAKDFSLALLLLGTFLPDAWAGSFSAAKQLGPKGRHFKYPS